MDGPQFDALTKALASGTTRRGVLTKAAKFAAGIPLLAAGFKLTGSEANAQASACGTQVVTVPGIQPWTDTGIDLAAGDHIEITASGVIKIAGSDPGKTPAGAPECIGWEAMIAPGLTCFALIGRIGDGAVFEVGTALSVDATTAGRLYLGVNDEAIHFGDNSGSWSATVTVCPGDPCAGTGLTDCGICVDPQTDPNNCGACDNVCPAPPNGVATCIAGACVSTCAEGFRVCGDRCIAPADCCVDGDCDDGDPCTIDTCAPTGVCLHELPAPDGTACDGLDPCQIYFCLAGICVGSPKDCDGGLCFDGSCDAGIPGGTWIGPDHRFVVRDNRLHFAAHVFDDPGGSGVDHVNFTAFYQDAWHVACEVTVPTPDTTDVYECDWDLSAVPAGRIEVSFDVYDRAGNDNLAPHGTRQGTVARGTARGLQFKFPWDGRKNKKLAFTGGPHVWESSPPTGIDFSDGSTSTHILAMADGAVTWVGDEGCDGPCKTVKVAHDNGWEVWYVHLDSIAPGIEPGQRVLQGAWLGNEGKSGATDVHIHLELRKDGRRRLWREVPGGIEGWTFYETCEGYDATKAPSDEKQRGRPKQEQGCKVGDYQGYMSNGRVHAVPEAKGGPQYWVSSANRER